MMTENRIREAITSLTGKIATMAADHPERERSMGYITALQWVCPSQPGDRAESLADARENYFNATDAWAVSTDENGEDAALRNDMIITWHKYCAFFPSEDDARTAYNAGPVVQVPGPVVSVSVIGDMEAAFNNAVEAYHAALSAWRSQEAGTLENAAADAAYQAAWTDVLSFFPGEEEASEYLDRTWTEKVEAAIQVYKETTAQYCAVVESCAGSEAIYDSLKILNEAWAVVVACFPNEEAALEYMN